MTIFLKSCSQSFREFSCVTWMSFCNSNWTCSTIKRTYEMKVLSLFWSSFVTITFIALINWSVLPSSSCLWAAIMFNSCWWLDSSVRVKIVLLLIFQSGLQVECHARRGFFFFFWLLEKDLSQLYPAVSSNRTNNPSSFVHEQWADEFPFQE